MTGVEAWLTLAAGLGLFWGRRPACRWVAAEARWWADHWRTDAEWRAESEPAYQAVLAEARPVAAARKAERAAQSEGRSPDARALRPVGTPLDIYRSRR